MPFFFYLFNSELLQKKRIFEKNENSNEMAQKDKDITRIENIITKT